MNRPDPTTTTKKPRGRVAPGEGGRAEKESSCDGLLEKILERDNLLAAWKQVRANRGAAGIDGMETGDFPDFLHRHWETIRRKLLDGSYAPSPVRRVEIPKPDGTKRPLGIPTVLDRVVQQAIAQILTPIYEPVFSDHSHGFRPARSAHDAIQAVQQKTRQGKRGRKWAVDCDLKSFFDTVDHDVLMERLRRRIKDRRVLSLIGKYLRAGVVLPSGAHQSTRSGVPQGGPLSPLLANILLDDLDQELEKRGHTFARYADDFLILCRSQRAAKRVLWSVTRYIERRLKLIVNRTKSKVCEIKESTFLGFTVVKNRIRWTTKSKAKFEARLREITKRTRGISPSDVMEELQQYIRGAVNYYTIGMTYAEARELDGWLRRRIRLYYWKQWGRPRARRRNLLRLGSDRETVHMASRSRKGPWRMSQNSKVRAAMNNGWLDQQGVPSIADQWISIRYPDGPKGRQENP
jgi:RNA-directed DNA polymerase